MNKSYKILELEEYFGISLSESTHADEKNSYSFDENQEIEKLNLDSNQISDISILKNLTSLTKLSLNNNNISDVFLLKNLTSLTSLSLNHNNISDISFLKNLTSLTSLSLNHNNISGVSFLEDLHSLTSLSLSNNQISNIYFFENLTALTSLALNDNQISDIFFIEKLTSLTSLILTRNQISDISFLENLTDLTDLNLNHNQISKIHHLENLTKLTSLNLSSNQISDASFLKNLTKLMILDLSDNLIEDSSFLQNLTAMSSLALSYNEISDFSILKNFKNLRSLYLSKVKVLDYSFLNDLTSISILFLSSNNISDISFLKKLKNIRVLYLNYNKISEISILKELKTITNLHLKNNLINDISILKNLKSIVFLDLVDNKIIDINQFEIIENTPKLYINANNNPCFENYILEKDNNNYDTIINILKKLNEAKQEYILPAKVLLLGNSGSGKSTLLDYLLQDKEPRFFKEKPDSTHIVQIETFPKKIKRNQIPEAVFYDFGGQDYYHGLYKAFLSSNSLNVLLWNIGYDKNQIRNDSTNLLTRDYNRDYWLHQLKFQYSYTQDNSEKKSEPILLVQTNADNESSYRESYKGNCEFLNIKNEFYISLNQEANKNSKSLKISLNYFEETLKEHINLKQLKKNEPIWFKDFLNFILKAKNKTFTLISELESVYNRTSDPNNFLLPEVLREIAQTGLILYYKDDKDLKDVVWLNSSMAIKKIHKDILSRKNIIEKNGIIKKDDFEKLAEPRLIKLLLNQKVIFFDSFDDNYIIPGYLPLTEADNKIYELLTFDFIEPNFVLKFEHFIPFGLINQMICFYGNNKNKKYYWRDQLLFTEDNSKILIKLDFTNLEISVSIKSNENNIKIDKLIQKIFKDILELYWDKKNQEKISDLDIDNEISIDNKTKEKMYEVVKDDIFNSPADLYISIDNKNFVNHSLLENKDKTKTEIISYQRDLGKKINKSEGKIQSSILYKNFTTNTNIKNMKKIFISYSNKDYGYLEKLKTHLSPFNQLQIIESWDCTKLQSGNWHEQIQNNLKEADIVVFMLSANFLESNYILSKELLPSFNEIRENTDKKLLFIVVKNFAYNALSKYSDLTGEIDLTNPKNVLLELTKHQFIPYEEKENGRKLTPIKKWEDEDDAYVEIINQLTSYI